MRDLWDREERNVQSNENPLVPEMWTGNEGYVWIERERLERLERIAELAKDIAFSVPDFFDPRYYQYSVSGEDMEDLICALLELEQKDWYLTVRNWDGEEWRIHYYAQPMRGVVQARATVVGGAKGYETWNKIEGKYGWEQETSPNEGGCWICHRTTGDDWLFSMEYDCHVHRSCLERATPDEEVEIIRRELGIGQQSDAPNS